MSASRSALETPGGPAEIGAQRLTMPSPTPMIGPSQRPQRSLSAPASSLIPRMKAAATMPATRRSPTRSTAPPTGRTPGCPSHDDTGGVQEVEQAPDPVGQVDRERGGVLSRRHQLPEHRLRREPVQDELPGVRAEELAEVEFRVQPDPHAFDHQEEAQEGGHLLGQLEPVLAAARAAGSPAWRH